MQCQLSVFNNSDIAKWDTYLGAGVDSVTNIEPSRSLQNDSVEEITLARSVHAGH